MYIVVEFRAKALNGEFKQGPDPDSWFPFDVYKPIGHVVPTFFDSREEAGLAYDELNRVNSSNFIDYRVMELEIA